MAQTVKSLPVMGETRVRSLGQEDSLEKEMASHSSINSFICVHKWTLIYNAVKGGLKQLKAEKHAPDLVS